MTIQQKLTFHVVSIGLLILAFQLLVGFEMSLPTALFFLGLLAIDLAGDFWTLLTIRRDVHTVMDNLTAVSEGDLSREVMTTDRQDETSAMLRTVKRMIGSLRGLLSEVRGAADEVEAGVIRISSGVEQTARASDSQLAALSQATGSVSVMAERNHEVGRSAMALSENADIAARSVREMVSAIQQVAGHTDSLAAAVSQTSASIEEMAASIQQVADHVVQAKSVSEHSGEVAEGGRTAVMQTIAGMTRIQETMRSIVTAIEELGQRSEEIGAIVAVIDEIADQTNLLALNAAIEAARAGEHGRGFAVVADEVRKLAERSSNATGEIAQLIQGIQRETAQAVRSTQEGGAAIDAGTRLATQAGESLGQIVDSVGQVTSLMTLIAQASHSQTAAAAQITVAVGSMNQLTQRVSAATRVQAERSEHVLGEVGMMTARIPEVSSASRAQEEGGEEVLQAVSAIRQSAEESVRATRDIAGSARDLQGRARRMQAAIAVFRDSSQGSPAASSAPSLPPAREHVRMP